MSIWSDLLWLGHNPWPPYAGKHYWWPGLLLRSLRDVAEIACIGHKKYMRTRTHPFPRHIYHQCVYTEAFRLISHVYTHNVDVRARPKANRCRPACAQTFTLTQCKGLFTDSSLMSMTHKQLPFSPMKGDPLPWHGTSRCITKPHSLTMASASFSYTGKHLLIFVTST